jgi:hypothetical protein
MSETLRPSTLGEILDRTASLYRTKFLVFFGLAAIPAAVWLFVCVCGVLLFAWAGFMNPTGTPNPETVGVAVLGMAVLFLLALPLTIAANALCGAALCHAAGAHTLGGTIAIASSLKAAWKRGWSYIGLFLLVALIVFGIPYGAATVLFLVVGAMAAVAASAGGSGAAGVVAGGLIVLTFVALVALVMWLLLQLCLAFPIAVLEQAPVGVSLKRAWHLCRGTRLRMLAMFVLGIVLGWVVSLALMVPFFVVIAMNPRLGTPQHAQTLGTVMVMVMYGISFAMNALTMPVYAIGVVQFYYDQRVRKEGFDVELLMQRAGMVIEPTPLAEAVAAWKSEEAPVAETVLVDRGGVAAPGAEQLHAPSEAGGDTA